MAVCTIGIVVIDTVNCCILAFTVEYNVVVGSSIVDSLVDGLAIGERSRLAEGGSIGLVVHSVAALCI